MERSRCLELVQGLADDVDPVPTSQSQEKRGRMHGTVLTSLVAHIRAIVDQIRFFLPVGRQIKCVIWTISLCQLHFKEKPKTLTQVCCTFYELLLILLLVPLLYGSLENSRA